MAYRQDANDIVIDGWENGIAESPHVGIADLRNVDTVSVPGEASVAFAPSLMTTEVALSGVSFTASNDGSGFILFTWAGSSTLLVNQAVQFTTTGSLPTNISANTAYYITNKTTTTFQVSVNAGGTKVAYSAAGSSSTFSTINMDKPMFIKPESYVDTSSGTSVLAYGYYAIDKMGRAWYLSSGQWVYMNNLNGENTAGVTDRGNGLIWWKNYLLIFRTSNVGYINTYSGGAHRSLAYLTTAGNWSITWKALTYSSGKSVDTPHYAIVGQDDVVYFCNTSYVSFFQEVAGSTFDPTNAATFNSSTYETNSLALPTNDNAQCLEELGTTLMVGGVKNKIYPWDRLSTSYRYPLLLSENQVQRMVTINTTMYIFAGQRGRIYLTNGTNINYFAKVPDHLSDTVNPYLNWGDACFNRNELYFGVSATKNDTTAINNYGGLWAIDMKTNALRLLNQNSYGSYSGSVTALCARLGLPTSDGYGLYTGWYTTTGGIDSGSTSPYTGSQAYVDSDIIPVGLYLTKRTFENIEFKLTTPLVAGESVTLYWRSNINASYTALTLMSGGGTGDLSGFATVNFENVQWIQIRAVLNSTATTPSFVRLKELRIR